MESVKIDRLPFIDDEADRIVRSGDVAHIMVLLSEARNTAEAMRQQNAVAIKEFVTTTAALRRENASLAEFSLRITNLEAQISELKRKLAASDTVAENERLTEWQRLVADGIGFLNQPEGQSGYEVASPEVVLLAFKNARAEIDCLVQHEEWLHRCIKAARRGHWWCEKCKVVVPKESVTFEETHQGCGGECK